MQGWDVVDTMPECIDGPEDCSGSVERRAALSASMYGFVRCDKHWDERLAEQERIERDYPGSPFAPAWFDPEYAGERWDDDY